MKTFWWLPVVGLLMASCVTLYKPNTIQSPLLKQKGDFNSSVAVGLSGAGLYNFQTSYAVSNHIGIMANGMGHFRKTEGDDGSAEKLRIYSLEAGAGYFQRFSDNKWLFQWYGGAGMGKTSDKLYNVPDPPVVNAKYNSIFVQPGIALINQKIDMSFDMRCNYINIRNIHAYLYEQFEWWNTDFRYYSDTSFYFINLEPTFTLRVGGKRLKGFFQSGFTIPTIHADAFFIANSASRAIIPLLKISLGICYTMEKRKQ